jgi:hypothetical protein
METGADTEKALQESSQREMPAVTGEHHPATFLPDQLCNFSGLAQGLQRPAKSQNGQLHGMELGADFLVPL